MEKPADGQPICRLKLSERSESYQLKPAEGPGPEKKKCMRTMHRTALINDHS